MKRNLLSAWALMAILLASCGKDSGNGPGNPPEDDPAQIQVEANSYMVAPNGEAILIPVSQANKAADPAYNLDADATGLGGVTADNYTVELVWGDTPVGANGVLREIRAEQIDGEGYVYVKPGKAGNAVVCVKVDGAVKWSWHIWVTEPVGSGTDAETGLTWMDRNLGAKSNTPLIGGQFDQAQWAKTLGLYYQWGRKDAFPGSDGTDKNQTYYTGNNTTGTTDALPTGSYSVLPDMVQNPLGFATNLETYYGSLNVEGGSNKSWDNAGAKTLYDPCPPGWRVSPIELNGKDSWGAVGDWGSQTNKKGRVFNGAGSTGALGHFYPASGCCNSGTGTLSAVGADGYYWSTTSSSATDAQRLGFSGGAVSPRNSRCRSLGFSVRCVAE